MRKNRFQKKKTSSLKRKIFGGLFFCLLIALGYFLVFSPLLWIKEIEIKELKNISEAEIREIIQQKLEGKFWQIIPQKSFLLVPVEKIKKEILEKFPEIKEVIINKKATNLLIVEIVERQSIGIWCQIEEIQSRSDLATTTLDSQPKIIKCFYIDKEGIVFKESPLISGSIVLNIFSSKKQSVDLRSEVVSSETIDFILTIDKELPKIKTVAGPSWQILDFEIISPEDLRVSTSQGCQIYFNPTYSVDSQLKALELTLEKEIKENWPSLEYVDLRIDGRVYFK